MNSHQFWNKVIYQVNVLNNIIYCSVFSSFVWVCVFWENLLLKLFLAPDSSTTTFFRFLSRAQSISTNELLIGTFYINWPLFFSPLPKEVREAREQWRIFYIDQEYRHDFCNSSFKKLPKKVASKKKSKKNPTKISSIFHSWGWA